MKNLFVVLLVCLGGAAYAEESTAGKKVDQAGATIKEGAQDAVKNTKSAVRDVKDKSCHLVKGKMECAGEKMKHKMQNGVDEVSDKANDLKNN